MYVVVVEDRDVRWIFYNKIAVFERYWGRLRNIVLLKEEMIIFVVEIN